MFKSVLKKRYLGADIAEVLKAFFKKQFFQSFLCSWQSHKVLADEGVITNMVNAIDDLKGMSNEQLQARVEQLQNDLSDKTKEDVQKGIDKVLLNKTSEVREVMVRMCVYKSPNSGKESTAIWTDKALFWTGLAKFKQL